MVVEGVDKEGVEVSVMQDLPIIYQEGNKTSNTFLKDEARILLNDICY